MTKSEFLKRCETIYDMGFVKDRSNTIAMANGLDCYLRLRSVFADHPEFFESIKTVHQGDIAMYKLEQYLDPEKLLAGDTNVYKAIQMAAILDHPCQLCAEDKDAWHTRYGFCDHRGEVKFDG